MEEIIYSNIQSKICYVGFCYGCGNVSCCGENGSSCPGCPEQNYECRVDCAYNTAPCGLANFQTEQEAIDYINSGCGEGNVPGSVSPC
jgi:hypothetical protein